MTAALWSKRISVVGETGASIWEWGSLRSSYRPGYEDILREGLSSKFKEYVSFVWLKYSKKGMSVAPVNTSGHFFCVLVTRLWAWSGICLANELKKKAICNDKVNRFAILKKNCSIWIWKYENLALAWVICQREWRRANAGNVSLQIFLPVANLPLERLTSLLRPITVVQAAQWTNPNLGIVKVGLEHPRLRPLGRVFTLAW